MPGDSLVARIDGVDYAVQMDVKATNSDGSVRHAVLTLNAPEIAPGSNLAVMLAKGSAAMPSPAAPSASALLTSGYNVNVAFTFRNSDGTTTTDNASAAAALQAAITAGNVQHWLTGPEVNEYDVVTTVNGGKLKVEFDIRAYADGTTTTDVIFDNSWMFSPGKSDLTYDVAISQGGQQVYSASNVSQYLYSTWHRQVDSAGTDQPQCPVRHLVPDRRCRIAGAIESLLAALADRHVVGQVGFPRGEHPAVVEDDIGGCGAVGIGPDIEFDLKLAAIDGRHHVIFVDLRPGQPASTLPAFIASCNAAAAEALSVVVEPSELWKVKVTVTS